ncbi:MAG: hypothetical protein ACI8RD_013090 [Bacillariaceae sp.]|jgi:hypothetical protein
MSSITDNSIKALRKANNNVWRCEILVKDEYFAVYRAKNGQKWNFHGRVLSKTRKNFTSKTLNVHATRHFLWHKTKIENPSPPK